MSIGLSIFLIAIGAILRYAVDANWSDVDEHMVGLILMWVGGIGLAISILFGYLVTNTTRRVFKEIDVREDADRYDPRTVRGYRRRRGL